MMGLPGYVNWVAWFLSALVTCLVTNAIITLTLCVNFDVAAVIAYTDGFLVYFYFTMYSIALIFMMFAVSTFINNGILLSSILFLFRVN